MGTALAKPERILESNRGSIKIDKAWIAQIPLEMWTEFVDSMIALAQERGLTLYWENSESDFMHTTIRWEPA